MSDVERKAREIAGQHTLLSWEELPPSAAEFMRRRDFYEERGVRIEDGNQGDYREAARQLLGLPRY